MANEVLVSVPFLNTPKAYTHREPNKTTISYYVSRWLNFPRPCLEACAIFIPVTIVINWLSMRTIDQTTQEVLNLASKHFEVPAESLAPDDDFFRKLGINSLQALELLSRLENHFGIELPDYEVQGVSDFRTLASRIQSRL